MRILVATVGLAVLVASAAGCSEPDKTLQRDADAIHALGLVSAQARLVAEDGRQHVVTSGVADTRTKEPVPQDGRFRIASTGKTFVAVVALQLVGEGRLSLDDTVERWLPGVVQGNGNDGRQITVRQLLQHTSGIPDDFPDYATEEEFRRHRFDVYTPEQLVARAMNHEPGFPPGTAWRYSSTGYLLVDMIIERVTGRPWHVEVEQRILRPLGLTETTWPGLSPDVPRPHARGYHPFEPGAAPVDVTEQVVIDPEGAIISTTRDLNRFFRALFGGEVLRPAQLAEMTRTVPIGPELEQAMPGTRYGLGVFERPLPCGGTYWSHPGGGAGYVTDNGVTGDGRRSVVLSLTSVLGHTPEDFARQQAAIDTLVGNALCAKES
ncbi:serine hydrolase domain-containing protein [Allorhizocola rhizosphaerae]|uniref:serine hydrolase domain-containing protein n=1 Tax=Allorhizocola rhizosphaerae TaxID=1872709 RepID=UPI001B8AD817|nr:serine hydrolase domain-containing protein [Allorhizocola rhizosphaerae]